jgi:hypothetical protein
MHDHLHVVVTITADVICAVFNGKLAAVQLLAFSEAAPTFNGCPNASSCYKPDAPTMKSFAALVTITKFATSC